MREFQNEWRPRLEHQPVQFLVRELEFQPSDELLVTNQLSTSPPRAPVRAVVAKIPFPPRSRDEIFAPALEQATART